MVKLLPLLEAPAPGGADAAFAATGRLSFQAKSQLAQFLLLASAEGLIQIVAAVPDELRGECMAAWKRVPPLSSRLAMSRLRSPFVSFNSTALDGSCL